MSTTSFLILLVGCSVSIVLCRTLPFFLLKGRALPGRLQTALELIPPAAFAALVANDLLSPSMFDAGVWPGLIPLCAAGVTFAVAAKTRSLMWCIISGIATYALLLCLPF